MATAAQAQQILDNLYATYLSMSSKGALSYTMGGTTVHRRQLDELLRQIQYWESVVAGLGEGSRPTVGRFGRPGGADGRVGTW